MQEHCCIQWNLFVADTLVFSNVHLHVLSGWQVLHILIVSLVGENYCYVIAAVHECSTCEELV